MADVRAPGPHGVPGGDSELRGPSAIIGGMVDRVIAACDGASKGNPGPAAWAYVIADASGAPQRWQAGPLGTTTNNVGELTALEQLLTATAADVPLEVRLDSTYTRDAVTKWLAAWKRNGWKTAEIGRASCRDRVL